MIRVLSSKSKLENEIPPDIYKLLLEDMNNKREEIQLKTIQKVFGVFLFSLKDEFGWFTNEKYGEVRLDRLIDSFNKNISLDEKDNPSLKEFNEWCSKNDIQKKVRNMLKGGD